MFYGHFSPENGQILRTFMPNFATNACGFPYHCQGSSVYIHTPQSIDVPGWKTDTVRHRGPTDYRLLFFDMLLRDFFSAPLPSPCPASSAFRFVPAAAAEALVLTETSVDLPAPPDAIFATCASAALQSAAGSLIAYLFQSLR
ncbi:hypothetical protein NUW54_g13627 [Trametes sanguinea]|uniref:Uncharacterized protein n=1 Tax=Trametes sanguinea TaxID=158606 RepID=A0ACC1MJM5_9APHY|nr:hypothetical protein NUW54_g13627 [Trametes sanguinea]